MSLIKTKLGEFDFWYKADDKFVGQRVAEGKYEEYETKLLLRQIRKESVVVDVGANIGYYTLQMATLAKKVYAIEPDKENFEILKKNIEENKLKNVVLINAAAGAKKEKKYLKKDKNNYGNSRLGWRIGDIVNCLRLDEILLNEYKIDLIKVDTQGWEPAVIEGAKKIIKRDSPMLFLEYWPSAYMEVGLDAKKMIGFLKSVYKNIWQIDSYLNIYKKGIRINKETGYSDLFITNGGNIFDQYRDIKIKKLIKYIFKVK